MTWVHDDLNDVLKDGSCHHKTFTASVMDIAWPPEYCRHRSTSEESQSYLQLIITILYGNKQSKGKEAMIKQKLWSAKIFATFQPTSILALPVLLCLFLICIVYALIPIQRSCHVPNRLNLSVNSPVIWLTIGLSHFMADGSYHGLWFWKVLLFNSWMMYIQHTIDINFYIYTC